jgi:hypothetical protein
LFEQGHFSHSPSCSPHRGLPTTCQRTVTNSRSNMLFGECVLAKTNSPKKYFAGGVCWKGSVKEVATLPNDRGVIPSYNFYAFHDKWRLIGGLHANRGKGSKQSRYSCGLPQGGAPLGRRSRLCTKSEENFSQLDQFEDKPLTIADLKKGIFPDELCANQGGNGFDVCAASGDSGVCLESRVARAMLDTCYPGQFCREDYICQRFPDYQNIPASNYHRKRRGKRVNQSSPKLIQGKIIAEVRSNHIGFCVPTYFLFNMRVDGHPRPITAISPPAPKFDRKKPLRGYP